MMNRMLNRTALPTGTPMDPRTGTPLVGEPPEAIRQALLDFRRQFAQTHPHATAEEAQRAVEAKRQELVRADPALVALAARAREAAEAQSQEAAARQREQEQRLRDAGEAALAHDRETARRAWLANGGTAAGFEHAWPGLRDDLLSRRAVEAMQRGRTATRDRARGLLAG
jgi:hypothetical protein